MRAFGARQKPAELVGELRSLVNESLVRGASYREFLSEAKPLIARRREGRRESPVSGHPAATRKGRSRK